MFSERNRMMLKPDERGHYFFDRSPEAFECVLNFYRTGKVLVSPNISKQLLKIEFDYFGIPFEDIGDHDDDSFGARMRDLSLAKANELHGENIAPLIEFIKSKVEEEAAKGMPSCFLSVLDPEEFGQMIRRHQTTIQNKLARLGTRLVCQCLTIRIII
jgi:hypothetical protein